MPSDLCKYLGGLCVFVWLFTVVTSVEAQTVTLTGSVSGTVALSIAPNSTQGDIHADVVSSGSTVRMTLSGNGAGSPVIRVPLIVRSNIGFRISGRFESTTAQVVEVSLVNVRATGRLVSPEAISNLEIRPEFDQGRLIVLTGPRISLGGTLDSSNNALQITLLIRIKSESVGGWLAHLTFFND